VGYSCRLKHRLARDAPGAGSMSWCCIRIPFEPHDLWGKGELANEGQVEEITGACPVTCGANGINFARDAVERGLVEPRWNDDKAAAVQMIGHGS